MPSAGCSTSTPPPSSTPSSGSGCSVGRASTRRAQATGATPAAGPLHGSPTVADDLDAIEALPLPDEHGSWRRQELLALVAEVRRLRAIEDAARAQVESERSHEHYP